MLLIMFDKLYNDIIYNHNVMDGVVIAVIIQIRILQGLKTSIIPACYWYSDTLLGNTQVV